MAGFRLLVGLSLLAGLMGACTGSDGTSGPGEGVESLRGRSVGVTGLSSVSVLELRYVLMEGTGLEASSAPEADVALIESSADSLVEQLRAGELDAAVVTGRAAYEALRDERVQVLSPLAEEMRELTGVRVVASLLVTYPDVESERPAALIELLRLLEASMAYFEANPSDIFATLATEAGDEDFLAWWFDRFVFRPAAVSEEAEEGIVRHWEAALSLGDLERLPDIEPLLFNPADPKPAATPFADGVRRTLSLAVHDDLGRRAVLYALEQGLVSSDSLDVIVSYLPAPDLAEAAASREHEVVEAMPLAVAQAKDVDLELVIVSVGLQDHAGTFLVSYR